MYIWSIFCYIRVCVDALALYTIFIVWLKMIKMLTVSAEHGNFVIYKLIRGHNGTKLKRSKFCITFMIYKHIILVKLEHINRIICIIYWWFCAFGPLNFTSGPQNYLRRANFVLILLSTNVYYILMKLEEFNGITCIIIKDFMFWPPSASF